MSGAVVQWCSGAVVQWCCGAVVQWCSGAIAQGDRVKGRKVNVLNKYFRCLMLRSLMKLDKKREEFQ